MITPAQRYVIDHVMQCVTCSGYQAALGSDIGSVRNLACPELIRVIKEFEDIVNIHEPP